MPDQVRNQSGVTYAKVKPISNLLVSVLLSAASLLQSTRARICQTSNALNLIAHEALASRGIVVIKLTWHSAALVAYMYLACTTKTVQCLLVLASATGKRETHA